MADVRNIRDVPKQKVASPKGQFEHIARAMSLAVGGTKDIGTWGGGHPFDVTMVCVPPSKQNWPLHRHAAQWEFFYIVEGEGVLTLEDEEKSIGKGDFFMCPPGESHALRNASDSQELVYFVIADNPPADVIEYPATGKLFLKPQRKIGRLMSEDYYSGEE